jgi:hypothetical protein
MRKGVKVWGLVVGLTVVVAIFWGVALAEQIIENPKSYEQASQIKENNENPKLLFFDNFSTDSAMWKYMGDAYRDPVNEYVVLTKDINGQVGVIWFNRRIISPFTIEFKYRAGGGSGGDGLTFMFYKQTSYEPSNGGYLGFMNRNGITISGYALEFDNWYNDWDPSSNHIALIKDHVNNHLIYVTDPRTEDNLWHDVRVVVNVSEIQIDVDNSTLFTWLGTCNTTYGGFGFSAGTGDANNWHILDNVNITAEFEQPMPDAYEPDDNYSLANYIAVNGTKQTHDFHVPGDQDWLKFNATGGSSYTIETSDLGPSSDTYLYLYDTDGTAAIRHDDDSGVGLASKISWYCSDSGTYYIMVKHYSPLVSGPETRYNISVNPVILPARFNDVYSDRGLDTDSNGLYDYLALDVGLNVSNSGNYSVIASLRALNGTHLTENGTYLYLPAGNQNVTVLLDGIDIRMNKINGPFVLDEVKLLNDSGNLVDYRDDPYITQYYNYTDFQRQSAELVGDLKDYGLDTDSNGLFDYLVIEKQINVTTDGNYELDGYLYNGAGYGIDSNYNYTYLSAGIHNLTLKFKGYKIYNSKSTGNFTVHLDLYGYPTSGLMASIDSEIIENSFVETKDIVEPMLAEINDAEDISRQDIEPLAVGSQQLVGVSSWGLLDSAEDLTSYYSYSQFEQPPARFNDVYSDRGLDTDSNGFYDYLAIDVGVNVSESGYYRISGELYNSTGWYVDEVSNYTTLNAGNQTVQLWFYGPRIWQSRTNGTFDLRYLSLYSITEMNALDYRYYAYTTNHYNYTDFRPPAVFMPGVRDYGSDENSNELFDYLVIEKQINVTTAGNYELDGHLYNDSGHWIDSNYNYTYLSTGIHNLTLKFRGYRIYYLKSTGNFTVYTDLYGYSNSSLPDPIESEIIETSFVEDKDIIGPRLAEINDANIPRQDNPLAVSSQQLVDISSWGLLDSAEDLTSYYSYSQFEHPPGEFNDQFSDFGEDTDTDGLYNYLVINVGVKVNEAGNFRVTGYLYDELSHQVDYDYNYSFLDTGNQTVQLKFEGINIRQNMVNGTFDVSLYLYNYSTGDNFDHDYYTTSHYNYTDFQIPGIIAGRITYENGTGIYNAYVEVYPSGRYDYTNETGYYEIVGLEAGNYTVTAYPPYGTNLVSNSTTANVTSGETTVVNLILSKPYILVSPTEIHVTLLKGELYKTTLTVGNNGTATLIFNKFDMILSSPFSLFQDNIESGEDGWTYDGLWHITEHRNYSLTHAWYYGVGDIWNFDTGDRNFGNLTSPLIDLRDVDDAALVFKYWYETETTGTSWDQRWVYISMNGSEFEPLEQLYDDEMRTWQKKGIGLSEYTGHIVQIRFYFDTIDNIGNEFEGWYVDDVSVVKSWLSEDIKSGEVEFGEQMNINITINATGLDAGEYYAEIVVRSNDFDEPEITIPVNLTVLPREVGYFDTGHSANPYPSIAGWHNGTIRPDETITVRKLYTYPCPGTGGHTEYVKIWNSTTGWNVTATWNGCIDDWHNVTFNSSFTLYANEIYNYTIVTGSYPQIIHEPSANVTGGTITCTEFVDINGKRHEGWIPTIKLY